MLKIFHTLGHTDTHASVMVVAEQQSNGKIRNNILNIKQLLYLEKIDCPMQVKRLT